MDRDTARYGIGHLTREDFLQRFGDGGQEPAYMGGLYDRLAEILTREEELLYVGVQRWFARIRPEAIVATNKRVINLVPRMLGGFTFHDYLWIDVVDANLKEGMASSELVIVSKQGRELFLKGLNKEQARRLYSITQEMEEYMRAVRREQKMEEDRARAGGVNFYAPVGGETTSPTARSQTVEERLASLLQLRKRGLISAEEYDSKRQTLIDQL